MINTIQKELQETITYTTPVVETMTCDICGKLIYKKSLTNNKLNRVRTPYFTINWSHCDWGNDSIDSYECFNVCSNECASSKFIDYLETECKNSHTYRFEIEQGTEYGADVELDDCGNEVTTTDDK